MISPQWFTTMREHCGSSLAIRLRPPSAIKDRRSEFRQLFVAIHHLDHVRVDGMPEPDYHASLRELDSGIIHEIDRDGTVVVVETYAGERTYYSYVADVSDARRRVAQFLTSYGRSDRFEFRDATDVEWGFYDQYLDDIGFAK